MKRLWPLLILLALACSKDKATSPSNNTYDVYVVNRTSLSGQGYPLRFIMSGQAQNVSIDQTKWIGSYSGYCSWDAQILDNNIYHSVGHGQINIDRERYCFVYSSRATWD